MARAKKTELTEEQIEDIMSTPIEGETKTKTKTTAKKEEKAGSRKTYFLTVRVKFTAPLLATNANNKTVYSDFQTKQTTKERREEEIERLGEEETKEKGMTVFMRNPENGKPQLKDYTWPGFFKDRSKALAKVKGSYISSIKAYIKEIDGRISITPRFIDLELPEEAAINVIERPLRAETMQGPRVSLASSEFVPEGTECEFTVRAETKEGMKMVLECLDYGEFRGTGQWRNAGNGTFTWQKVSMWVEDYVSSHKDVWDELEAL